MSDQEQQGLQSFQEAPFSPIHRKITAGAFVGQIADGYILGIVGIALSYAVDPLGLTSFWMGVCGAASMIGILVGSLIIGPTADKFGRKTIFNSVMLLAFILSLAQFYVESPQTLAIIRFALGICIGIDYTVGITLLSEWLPERNRVSLMSSLLVTWAVGYTIAYTVGFFMNNIGEDGWRYVLCTSAIPAAIAFVLRIGTPESPSWLTRMGLIDKALHIIQSTLGPKFGLPKLEEVPSASWTLLFKPDMIRKTLVSGIFFAAQVLPFYAISIFLPIVLKDLNIENPYASGVLYNVFTLIGVFVGLWLMTRIKRRTFLLSTFYGAAVILATMTIWRDMPSVLGLILITAFSLVMAIAIVLEYVYPAEIFPTELRGSGVGITVAISRIGAGLAAFLLPIVSEHYGIYVALGGCVATLLFGGVICQMWAPETSDKEIV